MPFGSQNSTDGLGIQAPAHEENLRTTRAPLRRFVLLVRHQLPYPPACVESQFKSRSAAEARRAQLQGQVRAASRAAIPLMGREMTRPRGPKNAGRSGARPLDGKGATTVCLSRRGILLHLSHKF